MYIKFHILEHNLQPKCTNNSYICNIYIYNLQKDIYSSTYLYFDF